MDYANLTLAQLLELAEEMGQPQIRELGYDEYTALDDQVKKALAGELGALNAGQQKALEEFQCWIAADWPARLADMEMAAVVAEREDTE